MASTHDVLILGSGIFGLTAAWAFADLGLSVRVVDKRGIGTGSSSGPLGYMAPFAPDGWNQKKAFQLRALNTADTFWHQVAQSSGEDPTYRRVGRQVVLLNDNARARALRHKAHATKNWGPAWTFDVTDKDPAAPFGLAMDDLTARIFPAHAIAALARALENRGVEFAAHTSLSLDDARATAAHVIVAAGHECANLLPDLSALNSKGVKGQAALMASDALDHTVPVTSVDGVSIVNQAPFGVAIGATREREWTDPHSTDNQLDDLIAKAVSHFPQLKPAKVIQRWAGIRPRGRFPDPVLGPVPGMANVWVMTGGYGISFGIAHELAAELARWVTGKTPDLPPRFFLDAHLMAEPATHSVSTLT